jgi:hypothetical protein
MDDPYGDDGEICYYTDEEAPPASEDHSNESDTDLDIDDPYDEWVNEYGELDYLKILSGIASGMGEAVLADYDFIARKVFWPYDLYKGKQELDLIAEIITSGNLEYQLHKIAVAYTLRWKGEIDLLTFNFKGFMEVYSPKDVGNLIVRTIQIAGAGKFQEMMDKAEVKINEVMKSVGDVSGGTKVTDKGIARIEQHLKSIGALDEPANQAMLQKLKSGNIGPTELRFYQHEIIESGIIKGYGYDAARAAHLETLKIQGIDYVKGYEKLLYGEKLYNLYMK